MGRGPAGESVQGEWGGKIVTDTAPTLGPCAECSVATGLRLLSYKCLQTLCICFALRHKALPSNHRMNHKTDWQPCPSGSMTKNPKLFLLFVDRVSGSPSQPQAHCVVKDLLQFLFLHLPECWGYDETTGVSHHTQFVQSWESNPGLRALEASALPTEPHQQSLECLIQRYLQFLVCQQLCVAITSVWPSRLLE